MKHYLLISLLISILITGCSQLGSQDKNEFVDQIISNYPELKYQKYEIATIKRTVDGDTFETESGQRVRIIGVNCPESIGKVEFLGKEASKYSSEQLTGEKVYMFQDVGNKDKYGRLLRYIFIENKNTMYNETLLIEGYANVMTVPPNVMFSKKFVELEREAREKNKGLWEENKNSSSDKINLNNPKIKGNINSRNEKIYHLPDGRYYVQTIAEEMFYTEEEANTAGYRKSKQ